MKKTLFSPSIEVLCVNEQDEVIGTCEKQRAHLEGRLHRAVSVIITSCSYPSKEGKFLLQQRAFTKYHSPGRWSNGACTHPILGETNEEAVHRALKSELGVTGCVLNYHGHFIYKVEVGEGLVEHELDHVFSTTFSEDTPIPYNIEEVKGIQWVGWGDLQEDLKKKPQEYSHWLPYLLDHLSLNS